MRIWQSREDVDRAVSTIAQYLRETGTIPPPLLRAYRQSTENAMRGLVQRFFEKLAQEAPEALKFFV